MSGLFDVELSHHLETAGPGRRTDDD